MRWLGMLGKVVLVIVLLATLAYGGVYAYTQSMLKVSTDVSLTVPSPGDAVEGARLARIVGCRGCHTDNLRGQPFMRLPYVIRLVAPNLTQARTRYTDEALVRLFRTGAKADGSLAVGMPHTAFQRLTDDDVANLIAFVRSVPVVENPGLGKTRVYPAARIGLLLGQFPLEKFSGDPAESPMVLRDRSTPDRGRHIAQIACSECHGMDFDGAPDHGVPPLVVAKGYSLEHFTRLMRTGTTIAGTDSATGLMSSMGRERFQVLTDEEIADLHRFLVAR